MSSQQNNNQTEHTLTCEGCDATFTAARRRRFCTTDCRQRNRYTKTCPHCREQFKTGNKPQVYCSITCGQHAKAERDGNRRQHRDCKVCGKTFRPHTTTYDQVCCSRECGFKWQYRAEAVEVRSKVRREAFAIQAMAKQTWREARKVCQGCGRGLTDQRGPSNTCSDECREAWKQYQYQQSLQERYHARRARPMVEKTCRECGDTFEVNLNAGKRQFCSKRCAKRQQRHKHHMKRLARYRAQYVEPVSLTKLVKQQDGLCSVCFEPLDMEAAHPHPDSLSIEHRIPLSRGGEHSMRNCEAAHLHCNIRKSTQCIPFLCVEEGLVLDHAGSIC